MKYQSKYFSQDSKYLVLTVFLVLLYPVVKNVPYTGSIFLHTIMETVSSILSLIIGILSLLRYYSRKNYQFLILGSGFLGTTSLDIYHTLVSSNWFNDYFPSSMESLAPWSWFTSRFLLSVILYLSYISWKKEKIETTVINRNREYIVYTITFLATITVFFTFSFLPLPPAYFQEFFFHRPEELVPGLFFLSALVGYYIKNRHEANHMNSWIIYSLIFNMITQLLYMPFSHDLFDIHFDLAHIFKISSYICFLSGLMFSIFETFTQIETETALRLKIQNEFSINNKVIETEIILQQVIDSTPVRIFWKDPEGIYLGCNSFFAMDAGFKSTQDIIGKTDFDMPWKEQASKYRADDRKVISEKLSMNNIEEQQTRSDGTTCWVNTSKALLIDINSQPIATIGTYVDITQIKDTEAALKRSEETFAKAQAIAHIGSWDWDITTGSLHWTDEIYRIFGLQPQEFGATYEAFLSYIHPDDTQLVIDAVNASVADSNVQYDIEHRVVQPSGAIRLVREQGKVYRDENNKPYRMIGTVNDVTEFKLATQALEKSEKYNRMLFENTPIGLALASMSGQFIDINSAFAMIIGYTPEEAMHLNNFDITPQKYKDSDHQQINALEKTGYYGPYEKEYIHKNGHLVQVKLSGMILEKDNEKFIWSTIEDITEYNKTQELIKYQTDKNEMLLNTTLDGYWIVNIEGKIKDVNNSYLKMSGYTYEDLIGKAVTEIDFDQTEKEINQNIEQLKKHGFIQFETRHRCKDSSIINLFVTSASGVLHGEPILIAFFRDITRQKQTDAELVKYRENLERLVEERTQELKSAQDELVKKERLATLGQLTATVSHELRNPLGAMRPSIYVLKKLSTSEDKRVDEALERIDRNINRCDKIIDELLDFTRISDLNVEKISLNSWLENQLQESAIPENIQIETNYRLENDLITFDPDRLRRAFINVIDNACHSMMDDSKQTVNKNAKLIISTSNSDHKARIEITDTGSGIKKEIMTRIFEPLFSTKGFGVGLGMPTVKQIMTQHNGGIEISSTEGKGTCVTLWLPINKSINTGEER